MIEKRFDNLEISFITISDSLIEKVALYCNMSIDFVKEYLESE